MDLTSERGLEDGVVERGFTLGDVPGLLWTPRSGPAPLVLMGHPGGLSRMYPRLVGRARHAAAQGFATATIELPGGGDRPRIPAVDEARAELQRDDAGNDRQLALDLFDAFGSREKTLHANLGGHTGVPGFEGDDANRFFARHLTPPAAERR